MGIELQLTGKSALITGGSRGIGRAIAIGLAQAGANIALCGRKPQDLEMVSEIIRSMGRQCLAHQAHVGKPEQIRELVSTVLEKFGRIDILVNNAGSNPYFGPLVDASEEKWDKIMNVNLKGCFVCSKEVAKAMIPRGSGSIINISSTAAFRSYPGLGPYCISKAAVTMLTKVLASELAEKGIRVNAVAPGTVKTDFSKAVWADKTYLAARLRDVPQKRLAEPEDLVGVCAFLASDASSYITGETILVDGGEFA
jgi:NAD(P)-dependent dehydrogenase (short-subunit alcohol dehydrogenase family)